MNNSQLAIQFFLQLAVILLACRLAGVVAAKFGQPQVVAEMVTGIPAIMAIVTAVMASSAFDLLAGKIPLETPEVPVAADVAEA